MASRKAAGSDLYDDSQRQYGAAPKSWVRRHTSHQKGRLVPQEYQVYRTLLALHTTRLSTCGTIHWMIKI